MATLKQVVRQSIRQLPRSRLVAAACRAYVEHCEGPSVGATGDPTGAGEQRWLRELAPQLDTVLDVGANIGDWSAALVAQRPDCRIHAFEPAAAAADSFARRNFPAHVTLHREALSSAVGSASLFMFDPSSPLNSLHNRVGLEDAIGLAPASDAQRVPTLTVDAFLESLAIPRVDYLKIDVEGHEVDVLQGSRRSLEGGVIRRVQFEYGGTYIDARRLLKDAFDIFAVLDFVLFRIVTDGLEACPRYDQRLERFQFDNFVALHRETVERTESARRALARRR